MNRVRSGERAKLDVLESVRIYSECAKAAKFNKFQCHHTCCVAVYVYIRVYLYIEKNTRASASRFSKAEYIRVGGRENMRHVELPVLFSPRGLSHYAVKYYF